MIIIIRVMMMVFKFKFVQVRNLKRAPGQAAGGPVANLNRHGDPAMGVAGAADAIWTGHSRPLRRAPPPYGRAAADARRATSSKVSLANICEVCEGQ